MTGYSLKKLCVRCQRGLLPNSIKLEIHEKIEVGCLTPTKEEAAYQYYLSFSLNTTVVKRAIGEPGKTTLKRQLHPVRKRGLNN